MEVDADRKGSKHRRVVVLDRDGTLIRECHYLSNPNLVELLPGTIAGLHQLQDLGFGLALVTNQSGIGRGYFDRQRLAEIHQRLQDLLAHEGIVLDGIYYCPHTPMDNCDCRKPKLGMIRQAVEELDFDPAESFAIGDKPCDIELGRNMGAKTILVKTGYGAQFAATNEVQADYIATDLKAAAEAIAKTLA